MMQDLLKRLQGGVWHVTRPDRFEQILADQAILPEPDIPNKERWATDRGPDFYPYARHLGGISLFDFRDFDLEDWRCRYRSNSLSWFLSSHDKNTSCTGAVWLKIDHESLRHLIPAMDLFRQRVDRKQTHRLLVPAIESAYIGPLEIDRISSRIVIQSTLH